MQPSYNTYKYQPLNGAFQPSVALNSDMNHYTPFRAANKLPGEFVPIFKRMNLPYKYHEKVTSVDDIRWVAIRFSQLLVVSLINCTEKENLKRLQIQFFLSSYAPQAHHEHMMKPLDEDEFIPMTPSPSAHYHKTNSQPISNNL
jgi:hypothetical protein